MADALLQHIFVGSTIYGKIYVNFRNFDKANALAHIHQIEVADSILSLHGTGFHCCIELFIIFTDRFLGSVNLFLIHLCNLLIIGDDRLTCMGLGDQVADEGIQSQTQARKKQYRDKPCSFFIHDSNLRTFYKERHRSKACGSRRFCIFSAPFFRGHPRARESARMSFSGREWENTTRKRKSQIFLSRLPQPQPVSKTDGDHRSIAPFRGKGGSEGAMHRAGRDPRPVPVSVLAHTKRDTDPLLIK